jgi:hypothetical protein
VEFLSRKGIVFTEKNVRADQAALKELIDRGFQSTPVTLIGDEAVIGFDQDKLEKLLGLKAEPGEAL